MQIKTHRDLTTERSVNLPDSRSQKQKSTQDILETTGESNTGWWYYRIISFIRYYNGVVAIKKAVSILRQCTLKYLRVKYGDICNLFSNSSAQKLYI